MRLIRLVFSIMIIAQAFETKQWLLAILGLVIAATAIFNVGCCGAAGCGVPAKKNNDTTTDISYEEVV